MHDTPETPDWELIEGYYGNTLSAADRERVDYRLANDPAFRAEAEAWKEADSALRQLAMRKTVRKIVQQESRWLTWQGRIRLGAAALTAACVVMGWFLFSTVNMQSYQQDMTLLRTGRTDSTAALAPLSVRQRAFYQAFFDGQSYLVDGQPELAIPYFERVLALPNLRLYFRQAVEWQLVNAYLQAHKPDNAYTTYQRLMASGEPVYPIRNIDRWRVEWQISWQKFVS